MGRNDKTIKTYGRHRNRVVQADIWSTSDDRKNDVFSLSSSGNSLSLNSTSNSVNDSTGSSSGSVFMSSRKTRNNVKKSNANKENKPVRCTRRMVLQKNFERDSCSSIGSNGSDILFKSADRNKRGQKNADSDNSDDGRTRVLRDTKNIRNNRGTTQEKQNKRKRESKPKQQCEIRKRDLSKYNFSDFDDYSLVISGSPVMDKSVAMETSTPCAKRTRSAAVSQISDNNISHIELTESPVATCSRDSGCNSTNSCSHLDRLGLSSIGGSPSILLSNKNSPSDSYHSNKDKQSPNSSDSPSNSLDQIDKLKESFRSFSCHGNSSDRLENSPSDCIVQVEKLRESMLKMHVSKRRPSRSKQDKVFDGSDCLFSSMESEKSSGSKYFSASENEGGCSNSEEDDDSENDDDDDDDDSEYVEDEEEGEESSDDLSDIEEREEEDEIHHKHDNNDTTLYTLANVEEGSSNETDELSGVLEEDDSYQSVYCTAESEAETSDKVSPEPQSRYQLRNKHVDDLNESIFEMITPTKTRTEVQMSPRSKLLEACQETEFVSFEECIPRNMMKNCKKVGEGVYGEVFRTTNKNKSVALKIIPIEGSFPVNDEAQKTFSEILPEIVISRELSSLRNLKKCHTSNFCRVNSVFCVQGKYPDELLKQWDLFNKTKGSENDRPDMFDDHQLFILFEFDDGGRDLESFEFNNIFEAKSAFEQVAFSLAVAEEALEFEHRDLHWGNVLVKKTDDSTSRYRLLGHDYEIDNYGVDVCIIDFTLSRLRKDGCTVFIDLSTDETLFEGSGDYQFDIYRKMKEENGNKWEPFHSRTNVFWLHYLADKLLRGKRYARNSQEDKALLREFRLFLKQIFDYNSASELVLCSDFIGS